MARPGLMRHRKFARLVRLLGGNQALARGHLEMVWEVAYENGDDLLGDAGDVEQLAAWRGKAGRLAAALVEAGFLDATADGLRVHDLWDHAPDYVRKRRSREAQRRTKGAGLSETADTDRSVTGHGPPNGRTRAPAPAPTQEEAALSRAPARGEGQDLDQDEKQAETRTTSPGTVGPEGGRATAPDLDPTPAPVGHPTEGATFSPEQVARDTARAIGAQHRSRALAEADLDARYPATARLLAWLRERGAELAYPGKAATRAAAEAACARAPVEEVGQRVLAAWQAQPRGGLGWFFHELAPEIGRRPAGAAAGDVRFGVAAPSPPEAFGSGGYRAIE